MLVSTNELWVRSMSIVFWVLFILYFYKFAKEFLPDIVTNISLLLLAWSPTMIFYSIEPRNYTIGMFFVMAQFYYFMVWLRDDYPNTSIDRNAAVVLSILMFWTHYFTILILLPEALLLLMSKRKELRLQAIKMAGIIFLGMLPVIIFNLIPSVLRMEGFWFKQITAVGYFSSYVYQFILTDSASAISVAIIMFAIAYSVWATFRQESSKYLLIFLMPVTFQWVFSQIHPMYHHRFFLFFSFSLYILIAYGIAAVFDEKNKRIRTIKKYAGMGIYALMLVCLIYNMFITPQALPHELRDASVVLRENVKPYDIILHSSSFSQTPFRYYLRDIQLYQLIMNNLTEREQYSAGGAVVERNSVYRSLEDVKAFAGDRPIYYVGDKYYKGTTLFAEGGLYIIRI
ncbi:MAG: glycosyltransferase family 39 protein [Candidatus Aenigmarchaeota archaeon]|nr:glycosyltransferase family 39 protein [Candidatus Aenigmarchaeota archaeon]